MGKKNNRNTRSRIVSAAWKLFYEQGYEDTTIDEIVERSGTSKGSFYHYFPGKDALLGTLSTLFDEKYEELTPKLADIMTCCQKLLFLNRELFFMIENTVPLDLLAGMYSSQLVTKGEKHLMDYNRVYYRLLRSITAEGQAKGEFRADIPANEIVRAYALCERALLYDWCLCDGNYSLVQYSAQILSLFLKGFLN